MKWKKLMSLLTAAVMSTVFALNTGQNSVHAEEDTPTPISTDTDNISVTGTNQLGDLLADDISEEMQPKPLVEGFGITNVDIFGGKVSAKIAAGADCRLVVGVYSDGYDDGAELMYGSAVLDVPAGAEEVTGEIGISQMPKYYQIRAYMIGIGDIPLTSEYTNETHTKAMCDLMQSDINDYEDYTVINLDENDDTNFMVYSKDVQFVTSDDTKNILSHEDGTQIYQITNYDGPTAPGTIVAIGRAEDYPTVFRIASAKKSGKVTTIQSDPSLQAEDVFAYIKMDSSRGLNGTVELPESSEEEGLTYSTLDPDEQPAQPEQPETPPAGEVEDPEEPKTEEPETEEPEVKNIISEQFQLRRRVEMKKSADAGVFGAEINCSIGVDWTVQVDWYYYVANSKKVFETKADIDGSLSGEISLTGYVSIPLVTFGVDIGPLVSLKASLVIRMEAQAVVTLDAKVRLHYSSSGGWDHATEIQDVQVSGTFFLGLGVEAEFSLLGFNVAKLDTYVGLRFNLDQQENHEGCSLCLSGQWGIEISISFTFGLIPKGKDEEPTWNEDEEVLNGLAQFVVFVPQSDIYFSNALGFGFGKCPNAERGSGQPEIIPIPEGSEQEEDGLTDAEREIYAFTRVKDGYAVECKDPSKLLFSGTLNIPSYYRGLPVVEILPYGFSLVETIYTLTLPEKLRRIDEYAFAWKPGMKYLNWARPKSVVFPETLERIDQYAFYRCSFTSLEFPPSLFIMGEGAFSSNAALETVVFPHGLTTIPKRAFKLCGKLKNVTLPDNVKTIGEEAFSFCPDFPLVLPEGLQTIKKDAFYVSYDSTRTETYDLQLPYSIQTIEGGAFAFRRNINRIIMPKYLSNGFHGNLHTNGFIDEIIFPLNWTKIPDNFCKNIWVKKVVLPPNLKEIGKNAFSYTTITELVLPDTVERIDDDAFYYCSDLKKIEFSENLREIGDRAFCDSGLESVSFPASLRTIGDCAFECCTMKTAVEIPENVTSMYFSAFRHSVLDFYARTMTLKFYNPDIRFLDDPATLAADYIPPNSGKPVWLYDRYYIYGYEGSTAQALAEEHGIRFFKFPKPSEPELPELPDIPAQTMTFSNLLPNTVYNFYDLLGDEIIAENLLYLAQGVSDETGALTVRYRTRSDDTDAKKYVKCASAEKPVSTIKGDVNGDFVVDVSDAVLLARFCAEDIEADVNAQGKQNADANKDGNITGDDVIAILRKIAKLD